MKLAKIFFYLLLIASIFSSILDVNIHWFRHVIHADYLIIKKIYIASIFVVVLGGLWLVYDSIKFYSSHIKGNFISNGQTNETYTPLSGVDRVKLVSAFVLLLAPMGLVGLGIITSIILLAALYIVNKDKTMKSLKVARLTIRIMFYFIAAYIFLFFLYHSPILHDGYDIDFNFAFVVSPALIIIYHIVQYLFFETIDKHEKWVLQNGLLADTEKTNNITKSEQEIQSEKPGSNADELLKWAELYEKGVIDETQYRKARDKILKNL